MTNNSDWIRLRTKLVRDLSLYFSSSNAKTHLLQYYALVDAAQVPELRNHTSLVKHLRGVSLFSLTEEHGIEKYGPILVPLRDSDDKDINSILIRAMKRGWTVSWLSAALSLMELAEHLAQYLNGRLADGCEVLVRYYDPRVLPAFFDIMGGDVVDGLMIPIGQWSWWDRQMNFITRVGGGAPFIDDSVEINIPQEVQKAFSKLATEDLIHGMLLEHCDKDEFSSWLPHTLYLAIKRHVIAAKQVGLTSLTNIYLYVSLAMRVHPNFYSLLSLKSENFNFFKRETDLPQLVLGVTDDDWDRLGNDGRNELDELRQALTNEVCKDAEQIKG